MDFKYNQAIIVNNNFYTNVTGYILDKKETNYFSDTNNRFGYKYLINFGDGFNNWVDEKFIKPLDTTMGTIEVKNG